MKRFLRWLPTSGKFTEMISRLTPFDSGAGPDRSGVGGDDGETDFQIY